jgi:DNA-binding GntR family transcriptional regulator
LRAAQDALADAETPDQLHETNDLFLRTLLAMARSPRLGSVMRNMSTVVPGNFFELVPGSGATQQRGTRAIVDAIDADDADRAADACVTLLTDQGDLVIKLLASRGMFVAES